MTKTPSRILNEPTGFMGLSSFDVAAIGYLLILSYHLLFLVGLELFSFLIAALAFISLVGVRSKLRQKVIRDYFAFTVSKKIYYKTQGLL